MTLAERLALCQREISHSVEQQKQATSFVEQLDAIKREIDWSKARALVLREIANNKNERKSF